MLCLQCFYCVARFVVRSRRLTHIVFDLLKEAIYVFGGQCQHSGQCCRSIMVYHQGVPINNIKDWAKFSASYPSFQPNIKDKAIESYDCDHLTKQNRCGDYEHRPTMCRQYPYSYFYQHGHIHASCGYTVKSDPSKMRWVIPTIRQALSTFEKQKS